MRVSPLNPSKIDSMKTNSWRGLSDWRLPEVLEQYNRGASHRRWGAAGQF